MTPCNENYAALDFGPSHRWLVFVCAEDGHPRKVGYVAEDGRGRSCPTCGGDLVAVVVRPVGDDG